METKIPDTINACVLEDSQCNYMQNFKLIVLFIVELTAEQVTLLVSIPFVHFVKLVRNGSSVF